MVAPVTRSSASPRTGSGITRHTSVVVLPLCALVLLTACGGGDADPVADAGTDVAAPDGTETGPSGAGVASTGDASATGEGAEGGATDVAAWPDGPIQWIQPAEAGGGLDINSRQIQPYLEEELGVSIENEYIPGGFQMVGTTVFQESPAADECETVLILGPPLLFGLQLQADEIDFSYEDFYPVSSFYREPAMLRVLNDAPWQTMQELVDDALSRPGEITISVAGVSNPHYKAILDIEEATGSDFNIVAFDGGAPARNALLRGEVDLNHSGVYNSLPIDNESRVLAVHEDENLWPELTDDAMTVNEALGVDLPSASSGGAVWATRTCYDDFPDRYQVLHDAFEAARTNEDFLSELEALGEAGKIRTDSAEEFHAASQADFEAIGELIERYPEFRE